MFSLLASLIVLGLAAIDPVGIAIMPVLLAQRDGLRRATVFLLGSALGLATLGFLFALGLGRYMLHIFRRYPWLEPAIEIGAGAVIAGFGLYVWQRSRSGGSAATVSDSMRSRLEWGDGRLLGFGAALVVVQSMVDVVFIVAMVNIGVKVHEPLDVLLAVGVYTLAALAAQAVIVAAVALSGEQRRARMVAYLNDWLERFGVRVAMWASLAIGGLLIASGISDLAGGPSLG